MFKNLIYRIQQKSLKGRFLFILSLTMFMLYLGMGMVIVFFDAIPLNLTYSYRLAFGILLLVYGGFRLYRVLNEAE